jgi:hypothetical protein
MLRVDALIKKPEPRYNKVREALSDTAGSPRRRDSAAAGYRFISPLRPFQSFHPRQPPAAGTGDANRHRCPAYRRIGWQPLVSWRLSVPACG